MFFPGKSANKKVDLRGRSRGEETREQVLERARQDRERRKQEKLEKRCATVIQSFWRGRHSCAVVKQRIREAWIAKYGSDLGTVQRPQVVADGSFLRDLLLFVNPTQLEDAHLLAAACRATLSAAMPSGGLLILQNANVGTAEYQLVLLRVKKLLAACLAALVHHRSSFQSTLQSPRPSNPLAPPPSPAPLLEALIRLPAPEAWTPFLPPTFASTATASVLHHLHTHSMFLHLAHLLVATTSSTHTSYTETLVTQLTVRFLSVKGGQGEEGRGRQGGIHCLLFVPQLWRRCPSLQPITARLCRQAITSLTSELPPTSLSLPSDTNLISFLPPKLLPGGRAAAGAVLLGNLLEFGSKSLFSDPPHTPSSPARNLPRSMHPSCPPSPSLPSVPAPLAPAPPARPAPPPAAAAATSTSAAGTPGVPAATALQLASLLHHLLLLLPVRTLFPGGYGDNEDEEQEVGVASASASVRVLAPRSPPLPWPSDEMVPSELLSQLQLLSEAPGKELVMGLVSGLLPHTDARQAGGHQEPGRVAEAARTLCLLLRRLLVLPAHRHRLLLTLAVPANFIARAWYSLLSPSTGQQWESLYSRAWDSPEFIDGLLPLSVVSQVFSSFLATADLDELRSGRPLPLSELWDEQRSRGGLLWLLKTCLWQVLWVGADRVPSLPVHTALLRQELCTHGGRLLGQLADINTRLPFAPPPAFHAEGLVPAHIIGEATSSGRQGGGGHELASSRVWSVLRCAPSVLPFTERARIFQSLVQADRAEHDRAESEMWNQNHAEMMDRRFITIRRNQLMTDAFEKLGGMREALKGRIRIQFIDEHNMVEAGVDGGGLFKDFIETLVKEGFGPQYGLFKANPESQLYPNPAAVGVLESVPQMLAFLGSMLGKALYEGILIELPFAPFFLKKVGGGYCDLNDLPSLDWELHRNLAKLRRYSGELSELCLTFTVSQERFGLTETIELKPGGADINVTSDNVVEYVHRRADFHLNQQLAGPTRAFLQGLHQVIEPEWLRMFNAEELQTLISGSEEGFKLDDLKAHTAYAGGYHEEHPIILNFWGALEGFTSEEQRSFLKFVTSVSRAPLLGFKYLEPPLCVQMVGHVGEVEALARLPTAATCMNLLKLPPYPDLATMRSKLLYSITSNAGFDLS